MFSHRQLTRRTDPGNQHFNTTTHKRKKEKTMTQEKTDVGTDNDQQEGEENYWGMTENLYGTTQQWGERYNLRPFRLQLLWLKWTFFRVCVHLIQVWKSVNYNRKYSRLILCMLPLV